MKELAADDKIDRSEVMPAEIAPDVLAAEQKKIAGIVQRRNKGKAK